MSPLLPDALLRMQSDSRLASLAHDGRERAFGVLIERYRPELLRYARRRLRSEDAEDAVQQSLLQAWDAISSGTEVRRVRGWLYQILRHTIASVHEQPRVEIAPAADLPDPRETAAVAEDQLRIKGAIDALAKLPPAQRFALLQTELEARSRKDIAASLEISESAVRGLVFRARSTLRQLATALTPPLLLRWAVKPRAHCHLSAGVARLAQGPGAHAATRTGLASAGATAAATTNVGAGAGLGGSLLGAGAAAKASLALLGVVAAVGGALGSGLLRGAAARRARSAAALSALLAEAPGGDAVFAAQNIAQASGAHPGDSRRPGAGHSRARRPADRTRPAHRQTRPMAPASLPQAPSQAPPRAPLGSPPPSTGAPIARESAEGGRRAEREHRKGAEGDRRSAGTQAQEAGGEEILSSRSEATETHSEETTLSSAGTADQQSSDEATTSTTSSDG